MEYCLYRSTCVDDRFEFYDLAIVRAAISNNERDGITGFLHRNDANYFQYIEGERDAVARLMTLIEDDHRHKDFVILMQGETKERRFEGWSMGYSDDRAKPAGLTASDTSETVLNFLTQTSERQDLS